MNKKIVNAQSKTFYCSRYYTESWSPGSLNAGRANFAVCNGGQRRRNNGRSATKRSLLRSPPKLSSKQYFYFHSADWYRPVVVRALVSSESMYRGNYTKQGKRKEKGRKTKIRPPLPDPVPRSRVYSGNLSRDRPSLLPILPSFLPYFRQAVIDFSWYTNPPSGNISH